MHEDTDTEIILDAESLAEGGITKAYQCVLPQLHAYLEQPHTIFEEFDDDGAYHYVYAAGVRYVIVAPDQEIRMGDRWGLATVVFFDLINSQLTSSRMFTLQGVPPRSFSPGRNAPSFSPLQRILAQVSGLWYTVSYEAGHPTQAPANARSGHCAQAHA